MQEFYIKKDSVLPILSMELIFDGRHTYNKFHDAINTNNVPYRSVGNLRVAIKGMCVERTECSCKQNKMNICQQM